MSLTKLVGVLHDVGAPILKRVVGTALGPVAGNIAGAGLDALAGALGVEPDPDEIVRAYERDPVTASERIKEAEANHGEALINAIAEVNQTMRAEMKSEHWLSRSWRPAFGFAFIAAYLAAVLAFVVPILSEESKLSAAMQLGGNLVALMGIGGAILGAYTWRRTTEKIRGV